MKDQFGREIDYLRISVTDRCNLRCRYCMPDGIRRKLPHDEILRSEEIRQVAECASGLGIRHIRITGGEPLVRKGCTGLVAGLKKIPGVRTVTMTTNGILLAENLDALNEAGIDGLNISLDTIDPEEFRSITGFERSDGVRKVVNAVRRASEYGIRTKINAVTLPGTDVESMIAFAREMDVDVRFIEMMPIGYGKLYPGSDNRTLVRELAKRHPDLVPESRAAEEFLRFSFEGRDSRKNITMRRDIPAKRHGGGPAVYFQIPGFRGSIGFISAVHGKFCTSCNRVRLTSAGFLKTCLCYDQGTDLRKILRSGMDQEEMQMHLAEAMKSAVWKKPQAHCFDRPDLITEQREMSQIGG